MYKNVISKLKTNVLNIPGWRTDRKIIVIESDDWGSIRSVSNELTSEITKRYDINLLPYHLYDALESEDDLISLFETLTKHTDYLGNSPKLTANCLVANPDFDKIRNSNFIEYYFELVTETFKKSSGKEKSFELWKEGLNRKIFNPQYHGREHLNISLWLDMLKSDKLVRQMFDNEFWGMEMKREKNLPKLNSMAGCNYSNIFERDFMKSNIKDGIFHFTNLLGYKPKTFIANNFIWDEYIEEVLEIEGIRYIQGQSFQLFPDFKKQLTGKKGQRHYLGQKNKYNQIYIVRNCEFEPSIRNNGLRSVADCLRQIDNSFLWKKPAIISSHRLNFIGSLNLKNRTNNLKYLDILLKKVIKKYPNVEFMTTEELGDLILSKISRL
jgi:hypothetical protein